MIETPNINFHRGKLQIIINAARLSNSE